MNMFRSALLFVGVALLPVLAVAWFGTRLGTSPHARFKAGDAVTTVEDVNVITASQRVVTIGAGATVVVKEVNGDSLQVDAEGGVVGWIPIKEIVPFESAIAYFTRLISRAPADPHNYYFRGGVFQTQGDFDLALHDYDVAIRLDPAQPAYYAERTICLVAKNQCRQAIASADQAIRLQPRLAGAYLYQGNAHCAAGDYASAVSDWKTAMQLAPAEVAPRSSVAELLACCPDSRWRDGQRAVELAKSLCVETGWHDSQLVHYLACAYAECGDFDSATRYEKQAIALNAACHPSYLKNFQKALALFESHQPLHELMEFFR